MGTFGEKVGLYFLSGVGEGCDLRGGVRVKMGYTVILPCYEVAKLA